MRDTGRVDGKGAGSERVAMEGWKIGSVKITKIVEQEWELALDAVFKDPPDGIMAGHPWLHPRYLVDDKTCRIAVQGFVVDTGSLRIMVDTCVGEHSQSA